MLADIAAIILISGGLTTEAARRQAQVDATTRSTPVAIADALDPAFERKLLRTTRGRGALIDIRTGAADRPTAIFVHGMGGAASDLTGLIERAIDAGDTVKAFAYDHKFRSLEDSSRDLASAIVVWADRHPGRRLRIVAHSMGGRVALGALASLQRNGRLTGEVELHLIASPIAGVALAMFSQAAPEFLPWIRPSRGMASTSRFQRTIDRLVLPSNVTVHIFVGDKDAVFDHATEKYRRLVEQLRATITVFLDATHMTVIDEVARLPIASSARSISD